MMTVLHPTYTFRIRIQDRLPEPDFTHGVSVSALGELRKPHRYFDGLVGKTGCDELLSAVKDAFAKAGIQHVDVWLERFNHEA